MGKSDLRLVERAALRRRMIDYQVSERTGDHVILELRGELQGEMSVQDLQDALERHYVDDGVGRIVVDLSKLEYISLEGIRMLLDLRVESMNRGKRFVVEGPQGQVRGKLAVTGVLGLLIGE